MTAWPPAGASRTVRVVEELTVAVLTTTGVADGELAGVPSA
jgi:hypothetical protein